MASESILDRLDRDPGGARRYVATLLVVGGATRAQVAEALARKFNIAAPTGRSITEWKNNDPELRSLIQEMEAAKRDLAPGEGLGAIAAPVNQAQVDADLFTLAIDCPPFGELMIREAKRAEQAPGGGAFETSVLDDPDAEDDAPHDDLAVLLAGHETAAEFEADAAARLAADPLPDAAAIA